MISHTSSHPTIKDKTIQTIASQVSPHTIKNQAISCQTIIHQTLSFQTAISQTISLPALTDHKLPIIRKCTPSGHKIPPISNPTLAGHKLQTIGYHILIGYKKPLVMWTSTPLYHPSLTVNLQLHAMIKLPLKTQ
ncbi:hypothetical protein O181_030792 [Austropuccinia psidii MF-1]|uniref:Uncharacterized protein n=1 Tax=Austropuccinia psidii MF-1 TaxID=1389203 RepID=A0A9Q3CWE7_9BASI|nr:hypothetical protein [Austropuccinia psidii MF-1]